MRSRWSVLGPHGIGNRWSKAGRAVTAGMPESQVIGRFHQRALDVRRGGGEFESHLPTAAVLAVANNLATDGASPHEPGVFHARRATRVPLTPVATGSERTPHGHRHVRCDVRVAPAQVANLIGLALGTGSRLLEPGCTAIPTASALPVTLGM
jgi:hypothetical protein